MFFSLGVADSGAISIVGALIEPFAPKTVGETSTYASSHSPLDKNS